LGNDLTRAQQVILEDAARTWIIRQSLDDWIARQPTLVTKRRTLFPVIGQRMRVAEHLARQLDRLGLERPRSASRDQTWQGEDSHLIGRLVTEGHRSGRRAGRQADRG
jgi:hypothetical protein